ncbi:phage major capsid protein [Intestinimonas butyriciproducens]|uniref:phage major capsid protein n=4 Tax=Intestinimonas butyriciproducens TaxID=1297617 RepID=UPI0034A4C600
MKYLQFKMEGVDDQGIFTGHASVFNVVDLDGDVVEPGAFAETLATGAASAGVLIFGQHEDRKEPLGRTLELREDSIGLYVKGQISDTTAGQDYRQLIRDGVLDQMSIGYIALEYYIDEQQVRHLTKLDLLEISIVNYPANTEARIESYKGGKKPMEPKDTKSKETKEQTTETGLTQEQLQALLEQAAEAGAVKALKAMTPEEDEIKEETPPADETKEDCREDETKAAGEKDVKEVKSTARLAAVQRKYAEIYLNAGGAPKEEKSTLPAGIGWVRYQKCMMRANKDYDHAAHIARKEYGDAFLEKQIKAMSVTSPTDGGYLVPEVYASEIIPLLRDKAIVLKLGASTLPMDRGNLNLPKMTSGVSASYVGELRKAKASKAKFGNVRLSSKKLMCKVIISNDLIRSNAYGADQTILNDATTAMALAMDRAAFLGKGTEFEPMGLFNMDIPTVELNAAPNEGTTGKLLAKLLQNNADTSKLGWAINGFAWEAFYNVVQAASGLYLYRDQMDAGKLNGHEFAVSNQIPVSAASGRPTDIVLGNWSEFMIGRQGSMESEMFREGTITDENGETVSAVDQDCTILRIIDLHDFGVRHEESFVIGKGLKTGA